MNIYKIIGFITLLTLTTITSAMELQCPAAAQIKKEWSIADIVHTEVSGHATILYQEMKNYGTSAQWRVTISVPESNLEKSKDIAQAAIDNAVFIDGGENGFGFWACLYTSPYTGVEIWALSKGLA